MKTQKWERRENKRNKRKNGMRIDGRSIFVIVGTQVKKSRKNKREE